MSLFSAAPRMVIVELKDTKVTLVLKVREDSMARLAPRAPKAIKDLPDLKVSRAITD